jgi:hypothetical protein
MGTVLDENGSKKVAFFQPVSRLQSLISSFPADDNLSPMPLRMGSTSV